MALSNSQYDSIMRLYNRTQLDQKHALDQRTAEIYERIPAIQEMNEEIASSAVKGARQLLDGDKTAVERLKRTIEGLREERQVLLAAYGYPKDYLEMRYDCPDCKDTGYREGKKCHCFRQREIDLLYSQSNIKEILKQENFSRFSYDFFDDTRIDGRSGKTAREYMRQVVQLCREYVEGFDSEKGNILFTGKTGLGKTFLSNCIARELIERCHSVVYLPAVEMFEIFSRERFSYDATDEERDRSRYLMECDLLIIDDLGTELVNTFTTSQLFYVINERMNRKKGTIISTNLPVNEMRDEFTDRVMSRIISQYRVIPLFGEDIRIQMKLKGYTAAGSL
ncbi:MAG: ATP-binding protein [Clostridium sp.]|nr:ATP-binding protein [Clostridium sp.]